MVGAKVCELTEDLLWFVCGLYVGILKSPLRYGRDITQWVCHRDIPVRSRSDCTYKMCHNDVLFVCIANYTLKNIIIMLYYGEVFDQLNVTII